jgi:hypothetical protein
MKVSKINQTLLLASLLLCFCSVASVAQSRRTTRKQIPPPSPPRPIAAEAKPPTVKVDVDGQFNGSTYTNEALGFALTLPQGWQAQDTGVKQKFAESTGRATGEVSKDQAEAQASVERTTLLLIAIKPTGGRVNPSVVGMTEDISVIFNVRTVEQYIDSVRRVSEATPLKFDDKSTTEEIGGIKFGVVGAVPRDPATTPSPTVRQLYYITLRKNHALAFILTFDGEEQLQACREILSSLKFR